MTKKITDKLGFASFLKDEVKRYGEMVEQAPAPSTKPNPAQDGQSQMVLFEGAQIRKIFNNGEWLFSVIDVIAAITESNPTEGGWDHVEAHG